MGSATTLPVVAGRSYQLTVSGTFTASAAITADAMYSSTNGSTWGDTVKGYESYGPTLLDVQLWNPATGAYVSPAWGPYSPEHSYTHLWTATTNVLGVRIFDSSPTNNTGALSLTVCEVPPPCGIQQVSAVGSSTPSVSFSATPGQRYEIMASGTYFASSGIRADAKYSSNNGSPWSDTLLGYESYGPALLDLQMWDPTQGVYVSPDWGAYSAGHTYTFQETATSNELRFRIYDYGPTNNSGWLTVQVCPVAAIEVRLAAENNGSAQYTNCGTLRVNGQSFSVGCNKDSVTSRSFTIPVYPAPACNLFDFDFDSDLGSDRTTDLPADHAKMRFQRLDADTLEAGFEDKTDDDFNDLVIDLYGLETVNYGIRNSSVVTCN
ncbi:hypothetical protein [Archangium lansingense]|uniref:Uncharacterized protein n=1 Tax=Archangium lansingense TaxID=2995310 RepID=A0ABT4A238_9BACT|nr:hypothetical protein [Archangium lansinium]MCY1075700.1 hypothetical protein [Archangium lansinium]